MNQSTAFVCPYCKGVLSADCESGERRYVCERRHSFAFDTLVHLQVVRTDAALFEALRALQEKSLILRRLAEVHERFGKPDLAAAEQALAQVMAAKMEALRRVVELSAAPAAG